MTVIELRRAARKPWRPLQHPNVKTSAATNLFPPVPSASSAVVAPSLVMPHGLALNAAASATSPSALLSSHMPTQLAASNLSSHRHNSHTPTTTVSASAAVSLSSGSSSHSAHLLQQAIHNAQPQSHNHSGSTSSSTTTAATSSTSVSGLPSTSSDLQVVILD